MKILQGLKILDFTTLLPGLCYTYARRYGSRDYQD